MADAGFGAAGTSSGTATARLRVLLFSDLQLDRPYEWATLSVAAARRAAGREVLVELLEAARQRSVDVIACAGDLFDRRTITPTSMQWLMAAFRSVRALILIAPGNRDFIGPLGGYTCHQWPDNVTVFDADRFLPLEVAEGITIWGAAHTEAHRARSFFGGFEVDREGVNLALFHGAERTDMQREPDLDPSAPFDESAIEQAGFDHALVGHYQRLHFGRLHTYPGSPLAHNFGPEAEGGAVLLSVKADGSIDREPLHLKSPSWHDCELDLTGAQSTRDVVRRARDLVGNRADVVRLRLTGRVSPDIVLQRDDFRGLVASPDQLILQWEAQVDADTFAEEQTIRGQFVREVLASPRLSEERRQKVLLIGLWALAGNSALEVPR